MDPNPEIYQPKKEDRDIPVKLISIGIAAIVIVIGITAGITLFLTSPNKPTISLLSTKTTISGTFDINGPVPAGSVVDITQKQINSSTPATTFASNVTPIDEGTWSFSTAKSNRSYEIIATLIQNGKVISTASPIYVTAPAVSQTIVFNITNLPTASTAQNAVISGTIVVNGYIPPGSTITVKGRKLGTQAFTDIASALPGQARQFLNYATAISGTTYETEALLYSPSGQTLGTSPTLVVTAPALNETITINSSATAPATPTPTPAPTGTANQSANTPTPTPVVTAISGSIVFNGSAPANSRIVVFQRVFNTSSYAVAVDNISPVNGTTWQWNSPKNATWYDFIAILKQKQSNGTDKDISTSNVVSIAAPASGVALTVNSGFNLSAPQGPINVTCSSYNSGTNQWNVSVTFNSVSSAQSYWYEIGTTNGGSENTSATQNTNGQSLQTYNAVFNNSTTYYARYAYANVSNLSAGNSQYSPFSSTTPLQCSH